MIKSFDEGVLYLEKFVPIPSKKHPGSLGLSRMQYMMDLLGNPERQYPTVHVGGTSGKGSTSTIIASILSTRYKVGLHTSPHLVKITERIKILSKNKEQRTKNRSDISDKEFIDLVNFIKPIVDKVEKSKLGAPSYFEIMTAMAFLYFNKQKVDIAVIEVGMGGRFDATNVIKPMVAVLTNVGLDHTEILGDTVEKIAEDKAGIIKPEVEVVTGMKQESVIKIINARMQECKNAKLSLLIPSPSEESKSLLRHLGGVFEAFSYRIKKIDSKGSMFDYYGERTLANLKLNLLGEFQVENAVIAIRAIEELHRHSGERQRLQNHFQCKRFWTSQNDIEKSIRQGVKYAFIPGRLEIVSRKPLVILDGAHNPDKMKALVWSVRKIFPNKKVTAIIAIKEDKNAREMLEILLPICRRVIFTGYKIKADQGIIKSYNPNKLLELVKYIDRQHWYTSRHTKVVGKMQVIHNAKNATEEAVKSAEANDIILVTGSLYLVGEIKKVLRIK